MRRQDEGPQRHAVELLVVLRIVGGDQHLMRVERRPHGLADLARQFQRGEEIHVVHVEPHLPGLHRIVKLRGHSVSRGQFGEQAANVSAVVESGPVIPGFEVDFAGIRQTHRQRARHCGRQFAGGFLQPFPRELVFRIEIEGRTKFRSGLGPQFSHSSRFPRWT